MYQNIKEYVAVKKETIKTIIDSFEVKPKLVIVQVGNVEASNRYVKNKLKDCAEVGIETDLVRLGEDATEEELLNHIRELNCRKDVTGFLVQLPLPKHMNENKIIELINARKDVDGFSKNALVNPGTPQGILTYLEDCNFNFTDRNAVVIGRSNIVGKPMARMLLEKNCNVTVIHSKTSAENKRKALEGADLIVVATGHRNTLTDEDIVHTNTNCFIVDVGININEEGKLCGDCESVTLREKTPVPGGCGLLTRLALTSNLLALYNIKD